MIKSMNKILNNFINDNPRKRQKLQDCKMEECTTWKFLPCRIIALKMTEWKNIVPEKGINIHDFKMAENVPQENYEMGNSSPLKRGSNTLKKVS